MMQTDVATGAFGYSCAVIGRGLLAAGHQVRTLTGYPDRAMLSREEYQSMTEGLCDSDAPSTGSTSVSDWIPKHGHELGRSYHNQLTRHYRG